MSFLSVVISNLLGIWKFLSVLWISLINIRHKPVDSIQQDLEPKAIEKSLESPKLLKIPLELYEDYRIYLKSSNWRKLRQQRFKLDGYRCVRCGYIGNAKQVHHTHYNGIKSMNFSLDQLETVCIYCHSRIHRGELSMSKDN